MSPVNPTSMDTQQQDREIILRWICRFGGTASDLADRFRLPEESERLKSVLLWAEQDGYIKVSKDIGPDFYQPTADGMRLAGLGDYAKLLYAWERRGEMYNRAVAAVASAMAVMVKVNEAYRKNFMLWDEWTLRRESPRGRDCKFSIRVPVNGGHRLHLPAMILHPKSSHDPDVIDASEILDVGQESQNYDSDQLIIVVEAITAEMTLADVTMILSNRVRSRQVSCVLCYAVPEMQGVVWNAIHSLKAQKKVRVYPLVLGLGAKPLLTAPIETEPEVEEGDEIHQVLRCVGEFEIVSVAGVAAYMGLDDQHAKVLVTAAVARGLLHETPAIVDGVSVFSLTDTGLEQLGLSISVIDVALQVARKAKGRPFIAAQLKKRYRDHVAICQPQVRFARAKGRLQPWMPEEMPSIVAKVQGRDRKFWADFVLISRKTPSSPPIAAMAILEHMPLQSMSAIAQAWAAQTVENANHTRKIERLILYVAPPFSPKLKALIKELGIGESVKVKHLPMPEPASDDDQDYSRHEAQSEPPSAVQVPAEAASRPSVVPSVPRASSEVLEEPAQPAKPEPPPVAAEDAVEPVVSEPEVVETKQAVSVAVNLSADEVAEAADAVADEVPVGHTELSPGEPETVEADAEVMVEVQSAVVQEKDAGPEAAEVALTEAAPRGPAARAHPESVPGSAVPQARSGLPISPKKEKQKSGKKRKSKPNQRPQYADDDPMERMLRKREQLEGRYSDKGKPSRLDVIDPSSNHDFTLIDHKAVEEFADVLRQQEVTLEKWDVSWLLLVNLAVLLIEEEIEIGDITYEAFKVSRDTFEDKVYEMHLKGAWKVLPEIIGFTQPERADLDWGWVNPSKFRDRIQYTVETRVKREQQRSAELSQLAQDSPYL